MSGSIIESVEQHITDVFNKHRKKLDNNGIMPINGFQKLLKKERSRVDRNKLGFSVIVFDLRVSGELEIFADRLINSIVKRIRISDELGWHDQNSLGLFLPETKSKGAIKLAEGIASEIAREGDSYNIMFKVYMYPPYGW